MFDFAAPNSSIVYTLAVYGHDGQYSLMIIQDGINAPSGDNIQVRLLVDDNPIQVIGEILQKDCKGNIHCDVHLFSPQDQNKIAEFCRDMIICVTSGVWYYGKDEQNELDALIQPYLDLLHQKASLNS